MSRRDWLFALALIGITFLVYVPAWNGQPIWDDEIHLTPPQLRSLHGLVRIWTEPAAAPQYYPLLHSLFWLEFKLWDGSVLPYHLVTIFFHAVLAVLVMLILRRLDVPGAWLAAVIFALHPVHVESVAWFSEIKNTLSGVFAAAAMLVYLKFDRDRHRAAYAAALAFFAAALLTKTAVVALPVVLLIVFWWKRGSLSWQRDLPPLVPFFMLAIVAGIVTVWVEQKFCTEHDEKFDFSFIERCLAAGRLFWFYLGKLFWPANLCLIYPRWTIDSTQLWQYGFLLGGFALLVALSLVLHKSRGPLTACLCFAAMLFPVLGFLNVSFFMTTPSPMRHSAIFRADHFQYLADIPIIALFCAGAAWLWKRSRRAARNVLSAVCILIVTSLALLTAAQSRTYRDPETCFRDVLSKNPESATAHNNLANVFRQRGALDEAIIHYRRAIELEPNYEFGRYNLGATLVQKGDTASAIPLLRVALETDPNNPKAYYSLGTALAQSGRSDEAVICYNRALQIQPEFLDAHTNLANLLLERDDHAGAMMHYRKAVELDPNSAMTHYNLAVGLARDGHKAEAIAELQTVLRIQPDYPDAQPLLNDLQSVAP